MTKPVLTKEGVKLLLLHMSAVYEEKGWTKDDYVYETVLTVYKNLVKLETN